MALRHGDPKLAFVMHKGTALFMRPSSYSGCVGERTMNESMDKTTSGVTDDASWEWDPSLYGGAAAHYARGRAAYPPELIDLLVTELGPDRRDRLLDLGCGPGSLTVLLAPHFAEVVAVDADGGMVAEGARQAAVAGSPTSTGCTSGRRICPSASGHSTWLHWRSPSTG